MRAFKWLTLIHLYQVLEASIQVTSSTFHGFRLLTPSSRPLLGSASRNPSTASCRNSYARSRPSPRLEYLGTILCPMTAPIGAAPSSGIGAGLARSSEVSVDGSCSST